MIAARSVAAPDWTDPSAWAVHPVGRALESGGADVFYVHPTTFIANSWNQEFGDLTAREWTDRSTVTPQAGLFRGVCRVFAPYYRQASSRAFREPGPDAERAYDLAYADVEAAFRHYLRRDRGSRPIILFGHSQGALHVARLLTDVVEPEGLHGDLVAAYVVGIGLSEGLFGPVYRQTLPSEGPDQTGCLLSWNSFLDDGDPTGFLSRTEARGRRRLEGRKPGPPLCTNPISFDRDRPRVGAASNPGTMVGSGLVPGLVGASVEDGVLRVGPALDPAYGLLPIPDGNMHMHDVALFYAAIRQDAVRRIAAYR